VDTNTSIDFFVKYNETIVNGKSVKTLKVYPILFSDVRINNLSGCIYDYSEN